MDDILEFSKGIKDCQHCLSDVKFISHLKSNINKYGLTDQIKDLLQFENTTLQLFKVETLADMTTLGATESLVTTIKYIYKKIEQFFAWVWKHLSALFSRVDQIIVKYQATQENIKLMFDYFDKYKVDIDSSTFRDFIRTHTKNKDNTIKIITSAGAHLHMDRINSVDALLYQLIHINGTYLSISEFEKDLQNVNHLEFFSKNNNYSCYIQKLDNGELIVKSIPFENIFDFKLEDIELSGWNKYSLNKLKTILTTDLPRQLNSKLLSKNTINDLRHNYDELTKLLRKYNTTSSNNTDTSESEMVKCIDTINRALIIDSVKIGLLPKHINDIEYYIYLVYSAIKKIYSLHNKMRTDG